MTKHTPGPWTVSKFSDTKSWSIYGNGGVRSLASVKLSAEDARLIAAAPTMLEYIESSASAGCATAKAILEQINGSR